ncbi:MAG: triose-phosphate isomerase [Microbacter sp.]
MRKNIVAGNWKMNKTLQEGVALATEIVKELKNKPLSCEVILGTPFIHLASVSSVVDQSGIHVAAQNCADKAFGAFTGEVSAAMVKSTGADYVILGHSERREYYHETSDILNRKVALALENGLTPIYCCGEALEVRNANKQNDFVQKQLEETIFNLSPEAFKKIVIAYEPIWAIGTGVTASTAQAQEMLAFIRGLIAQKYGKEMADNTSILYGGSCNAANAPELFAQPDIDGGLIGGASLKAADFIAIVHSF